MKKILIILISALAFGFTLTDSRFAMPFKKIKEAKITGKFGYTFKRLNPHFLRGMSISIPTGTEILSIGDGLVTQTCIDSCFGGFGRMIRAKYQDSIEVYYCHLSKVNVDSGDVIETGEIIGLSGNTGMSVAPQLGLRMNINDTFVDPELYINFDLD